MRRYRFSILAFVVALTMLNAASRGPHGSHLAEIRTLGVASLNVLDIVLLMGSGFFVGIGALALFGKLKIKSPDHKAAPSNSPRIA